jgi:hypothetical protein
MITHFRTNVFNQIGFALRFRGSLAFLIYALVFESLRFGELTSGVFPATALLISAGKLKMKVRIIRILRDGDLQWRNGFGGLALLEQDLAEQRAGVS